MALRTKLAKKVLTKKLQRHLTAMNIHSMRGFELTRKHQHKVNQKDGKECCWECREIAKRLGIEP